MSYCYAIIEKYKYSGYGGGVKPSVGVWPVLCL